VYRFFPGYDLASSTSTIIHAKWEKYNLGQYAPSAISLTPEFTMVSLRDTGSFSRKYLSFKNSSAFMLRDFTSTVETLEPVDIITFFSPH
jgi:hypothetical protein